MTKNKSPGNKTCFSLLAAFVAGLVVFGLSSMTVSATDQANFCGSCHVMSEQVLTHSLGVHARQDCNQCHTPHNGTISRLAYKTKAGLSDIVANYMKLPDRINATASMKQVIQDNCVRCHYETVRQVNMTVKPYCTDCHKSVPHMPKIPIDRRKAADG